MTATSLSSSLSLCHFHSANTIIPLVFRGVLAVQLARPSLESSWFSSTVSRRGDAYQRCRWQTRDICSVCFQHPQWFLSSFCCHKLWILTPWKHKLQNFDQNTACQDPIQLHFNNHRKLCQRCIKLVHGCHAALGLHLMSFFCFFIYIHTLVSEVSQKSFEITNLLQKNFYMLSTLFTDMSWL